METAAAAPGPLHALAEPLHWVTAGIEAASIVILLIGAARFLAGFALSQAAADGAARRRGMDRARVELGRYILAGLELLIVADVIHTALSYSLDGVIYLAALVGVRSVISFFLTREIESLEARERREETA